MKRMNYSNVNDVIYEMIIGGEQKGTHPGGGFHGHRFCMQCHKFLLLE